jgi:hypothetical protein
MRKCKIKLILDSSFYLIKIKSLLIKERVVNQ